MRSLDFFCLIGLIWANAAIATIGPAQEALKNAKIALVAYDEVVKQYEPLSVFHETLQAFTRNHTGLSNTGCEMVGQLTTMLLNIDSEYFQAKLSVKSFCGESVGLIDGFVQLFVGYCRDNSDAQNDLLQGILQTADDKLGKSRRGLEETVTKFNAASSKLDGLLVQLRKDFKEDSEFFMSEFKAAKVAIILLTNPVPPMSGLETNQRNVQLTPPSKHFDNKTDDGNNVEITENLKKRFAEIEQFFVDLKNQMNSAGQIDFETTDKKLKASIEVLKGSHTRVNKKGVYAESAEFEAIKSAAEDFTEQCKGAQTLNSPTPRN